MKSLWEKWKLKWNVSTDKRMLWIFLVFAITGSSTVFVRKYIFEVLGISFDNAAVQIIVKILAIYVVYQLMLFIIGSLMGEHKFVKWFIWKMNKRLLPKKTRIG